MELRHLRFFVAVAEERSLTTAASKRLHTAQPSLSRQMRDLEYEVGVSLMTRSALGIELTAAGTIFLEHARLALAQVEAGTAAARRTAQPVKVIFGLGFLTGQEMQWLPQAMRILRDDLPNINVTISSGYSPALADKVERGELDLAFMRAEVGYPDLEYHTVSAEPILAVLPRNHKLAATKTVRIRDLAHETYIGMSPTAPVLQGLIDAYLERSDVTITPGHRVDNLAMGLSMVASTRGFALIPAYVNNFLPRSVVSRPLTGDQPKIDLVVGYSNLNKSAVLRRFKSRLNELVAAKKPMRHTKLRH
jgi:LysR family hca operon transcriptional activator